MEIFSFPPENAESVVRYNPPSPSPIEKPFSFGYTPDKQIESEINHFKEENRMLN
jgi:hypothetical protein